MAPTKIGYTTDLVTDFVINKGNGTNGFSETGIKTIPEQYIQPLAERTMNKDAAEKWFFQIINHGVPIEVLDNVKKATFRFFDLPVEEKNKYSKENLVSNNVRYATSFIPKAEKALEWKDYLSLFYVSEDEANRLWPSACK
ncbi:hypothetical protein TIFTF001_012856 [Ficus carica]|uniref:Non-haem dioxygenase N-terminal domain-containing protein n=1 Tax=Ficus carica TaxID=3494 RepID=A0AA88A342_FICCA|nr:hypothetical protein TIFTF001_012856 [Ficus carica]